MSGNANPCIVLVEHRASDMIHAILDEIDPEELLSLVIDDLIEERKTNQFETERDIISKQLELLINCRDNMRKLSK